MNSFGQINEMELTFSPKVAFCSPKEYNHNKFISDVNSSLSDLDFLTDDPPPPIPKEIMYEPQYFKIKKMASEIGNILERAKTEHFLKEDDVISSFLKADFNFTKDFQLRTDDIESIRNVFDFVSKNHKNVHFASPMYPANDTLIVVSLMTPKSTNSELKRQVHQCFLVLGRNTFHQLADKFICPICRISEIMADTHCAPAQLEVDNKIIYNFNHEFDKPISSILTKINCCGNYKSNGGCTHLISFNCAFAVHVDESIQNDSFIQNSTNGIVDVNDDDNCNNRTVNNDNDSANTICDTICDTNINDTSNSNTNNDDQSIFVVQQDDSRKINKSDEISNNNDNNERDDAYFMEEDSNKNIIKKCVENTSNISTENKKSEDIDDEKKNVIQSRHEYNFNSSRIQHYNFSFPIELNGKGANPPSCFVCKIRPAPIAVKINNESQNDEKNSNKHMKYKDDEDEEEEDVDFFQSLPFNFYCKKCFSEQDIDQDTLVIDLTEYFFKPILKI